jgi:urease gamma subunit
MEELPKQFDPSAEDQDHAVEAEVVPSEEEKEKSGIEKALDLNRREFALAKLHLKDKSLTQGDYETKGFEKNYREAVGKYRQETLSKLKDQYGGEELEKKAAELLQKTVVEEAANLYDLQTEIKLEGRGDSKIEKIKKSARGVVDGYRQLSFKKKLAISAGLLGLGVVAGAVGGATGTALLAGAFVGGKIQRGLSGAATAVGVEALMKKAEGALEKREVSKEFSKNLLEALDKKNNLLNDKLLILESKKKGKEIFRYTLSGALGIFVASGMVGRAMKNAFGLEMPGEVSGAGKAAEVMIDEKGEGISQALKQHYMSEAGGGLDEKSALAKTMNQLKNPLFYKEGKLQDLVKIGDKISLDTEGNVVGFQGGHGTLAGLGEGLGEKITSGVDDRVAKATEGIVPAEWEGAKDMPARAVMAGEGGEGTGTLVRELVEKHGVEPGIDSEGNPETAGDFVKRSLAIDEYRKKGIFFGLKGDEAFKVAAEEAASVGKVPVTAADVAEKIVERAETGKVPMSAIMSRLDQLGEAEVGQLITDSSISEGALEKVSGTAGENLMRTAKEIFKPSWWMGGGGIGKEWGKISTELAGKFLNQEPLTIEDNKMRNLYEYAQEARKILGRAPNDTESVSAYLFKAEELKAKKDLLRSLI